MLKPEPDAQEVLERRARHAKSGRASFEVFSHHELPIKGLRHEAPRSRLRRRIVTGSWIAQSSWPGLCGRMKALAWPGASVRESPDMAALVLGIIALLVAGLFFLGYWLAGRWWTGGARVAIGLVFGVLFVLALAGICVGGCTAILFSR